LHFRKPENSEKIDLINMGDAVIDHNFMDSLDENRIKGNFNHN
jgi:hypothetical protein